MFFLFALLATLAYALNNTLMTSYYRKVDLLLAVTIRGIGMGITMLPLLFIAGKNEIIAVMVFLPLILLASVCALIGNICIANAFKYLPIGIASALSMSFSAVVTALLSWQLNGEALTRSEIFWFSMILIGVFGIGFSKINSTSGQTYHVGKGVLSSIGFSLLLGVCYIITADIAKKVNPLAVGYFWETSVGLIGLLILIPRYYSNRNLLKGLTKKDYGLAILYSIPGSIGTACYSLAVANGPVAIVTAVLGTMMVANSIFAWMIYREKLNYIQWILIVYVACMIVGLKFSG